MFQNSHWLRVRAQPLRRTVYFLRKKANYFRSARGRVPNRVLYWEQNFSFFFLSALVLSFQYFSTCLRSCQWFSTASHIQKLLLGNSNNGSELVQKESNSTSKSIFSFFPQVSETEVKKLLFLYFLNKRIIYYKEINCESYRSFNLFCFLLCCLIDWAQLLDQI